MVTRTSGRLPNSDSIVTSSGGSVLRRSRAIRLSIRPSMGAAHSAQQASENERGSENVRGRRSRTSAPSKGDSFCYCIKHVRDLQCSCGEEDNGKFVCPGSEPMKNSKLHLFNSN